MMGTAGSRKRAQSLGGVLVVLVSVAMLLLAGCGAGGAEGGAPGKAGTPAKAFRGEVDGGGPQNPLGGSTVILYAMGPAGASGGTCSGSACYGTNALELARTTSDGSGSFSFNVASYSCSSLNDAAAETYIVALGGNAGQGTNSAIGLMALTGPCDMLAQTTFITVNELTTVAAEWACTQFGNPSGINLGAPGDDRIGLKNSYTFFGNLVEVNAEDNSVTGKPSSFLPGTEQCSTSSPPASCEQLLKLNTLADVLSACVESAGQGSGSCNALFSETDTPFDGTTLAAAHHIAAHPAANASGLFMLSAGKSSNPFQPELTASPSDWTIALNYTGGGITDPAAVAIDAAGDAWVAGASGTVVEIAPGGSVLSGTSGFTGGGLDHCFGIAIDKSGNVWVTDKYNLSTNGAVTELSSSGAVLSGATGYTAGGIDYPLAVAIDTSGNVWVANYGNASLTQNPQSSSAANFTGGGLSFPVSLSVDAAGDLWTANFGNNTVSVFGPDGSPQSGRSGYTTNGFNGPYSIAVDSTGQAWISNYYGNSISEINAFGDPSHGSPFTGGGLAGPAAMALDGDGNVWVSNYNGNSLTELQGSTSSVPGALISGTSGFQGGLDQPYGLAIDPSGNVWVANFKSNSVTVFLGIAAPVKTPVFGPPLKP